MSDSQKSHIVLFWLAWSFALLFGLAATAFPIALLSDAVRFGNWTNESTAVAVVTTVVALLFFAALTTLVVWLRQKRFSTLTLMAMAIAVALGVPFLGFAGCLVALSI